MFYVNLCHNLQHKLITEKNAVSTQQNTILNYTEFGIEDNAKTPLDFSAAYTISDKLLAAIIHSEKECQHIPYAATHEGASDTPPVISASSSVIDSIKQESMGALDIFSIFKSALAFYLIRTLLKEAKMHSKKLDSALTIYTKLALKTHDLNQEAEKLLEAAENLETKNNSSDKKNHEEYLAAKALLAEKGILENGVLSEIKLKKELKNIQRRVDYACKKADDARINAGILFDKTLENDPKYKSPADVVKAARRRKLITPEMLQRMPHRLKESTETPKTSIRKIFADAASSSGHFAKNIVVELYNNFSRYPKLLKSTTQALPKAAIIALQYKFLKNELRDEFKQTQHVKPGKKAILPTVTDQQRERLKSLGVEIGMAKGSSYACLVQATFALSQAVSCVTNIFNQNYGQATTDWISFHCLILAQIAFNEQVEVGHQILHGDEAHKVDNDSREKGLLDQDTQLLPPEEEKPTPPSQANDNTPEP